MEIPEVGAMGVAVVEKPAARQQADPFGDIAADQKVETPEELMALFIRVAGERSFDYLGADADRQLRAAIDGIGAVSNVYMSLLSQLRKLEYGRMIYFNEREEKTDASYRVRRVEALGEFVSSLADSVSQLKSNKLWYKRMVSHSETYFTDERLNARYGQMTIANA
jgi:hypothetical protein